MHGGRDKIFDQRRDERMIDKRAVDLKQSKEKVCKERLVMINERRDDR
jgi:hypothetical protein